MNPVVRQKQALEKREVHAPHLWGLTKRGGNFSMWGGGGGGGGQNTYELGFQENRKGKGVRGSRWEITQLVIRF